MLLCVGVGPNMIILVNVFGVIEPLNHISLPFIMKAVNVYNGCIDISLITHWPHANSVFFMC